MATDIWTGSAFDDYTNTKYWSLGRVPGAGDDVTVESTLADYGDDAVVAFVTVPGDFGIDKGVYTITGGLTITTDGGFEVSDPGLLDPDPAGPSTVTIGGVFTNYGLFGFGKLATVTMVTLDNEASGGGDMRGQVTITNFINTGGQTNEFGFGADHDGGDHGGKLTVTGTFKNSGGFAIGNSGAASSETMTMAALVNEATGRIGIHDATVTIGDVDNAGAGASDDGIFIDVGSGDQGSLFHVTGTFTNTGEVGIGGDASGSTATIATFDNEAAGGVDIDDASVTVDNLNNAGSSNNGGTGGFGVDYPSTAFAFETGGSLTVTNAFINTGDFAVGSISSSKAPSATTVTVKTFDNQSTGGVNILAGTVTITTLTNAGAPSDSVPHAGIGIDQLPAQPGGGNLTVTGVFTNAGDFVIGNSGMTGSATAKVGTLANNGGTIVLTAGAAASQVELELGATPTTWYGVASLAGGTPGSDGVAGIAGTALLVMGDNGKIGAIAAGGVIQLLGEQAFVADANNTSASGALSGLTGINGSLDLEQGAEVTVGGNLTNNGVTSKKGGITVDFEANSSESSLTVVDELVNNGFIGLGNTEVGAVDDEEALDVGKLDNTAAAGIGIINTAMEVKGNAINAGVGTDNGIGVDIVDGASGGGLTVDGTLTNSGVVGVGNAKDDGSTSVTLGALDNAAAGRIGVENAALTVTGAVTNAGVGVGKGIGVDIAAGSGDGSLEIGGELSNTADIAIGNTTDSGSTTAAFAAIVNSATGSIAIIHAAATLSGNLTNAGVGTTAGIGNGIGVDYVDGASGGSLAVKGTLANSGEAGFGNAGDDGSTNVTIGLVNNEAAGSIGIMNAAVTVTGNLVNAGVGAGNGIAVGAEDGSTASSLTVEGTLTSRGDMEVGDDSADGGQGLVTAKNFTNTGLVDIGSSSTTSVPTVAVAATYTQAAGSPGLTNVDGTLSAFAVALTGGTIDGAGLIVGPVKNTGGNLQAGQNLTTPGTLSIGGASPGSYTQGASGKLSELVAGVASGQFGVVEVNGAVSLAGVLAIEAINGFAFANGQSFDIVTFTDNKLTGTFSAVDFGAIAGNAHDVLIGGGLAIVANYEDSKGQIDLDVVATKVSVATFESEESILNQILTGFTVADSAANIEAALPKLAADATHIDSITSNSGVVVAPVLNFKADEPALNEVVGGVEVDGSGANIAANFAALDGDIAHIASVSLTGGTSPVLSLTQAQATADAALVKLVSNPYVLNVANGAATTTTGHGDNLTIDAAAGGADTITGGGTTETFVFSPSFGQDTITDFSAHDAGAGHDLISLPFADFESFSAMVSASSNLDGNVVITATGGDKLTLDNLSVTTLKGLIGDFNFPA